MEKQTVQLESLSPNVIVDDVNQAVAWYTGNLGFQFITSVPEKGTFNWAMVKRDGITIMFQSLPSIQEDLPTLKFDSKGSLGTFYIRIKGINQFYQDVKGKAEIAADMRTTFYGMKEFTVKDLNGYFLTFAEEVK